MFSVKYMWKEPVYNEEGTFIDLINPHSDPHYYETPVDFIFDSVGDAMNGLTDWDLMSEALQEKWVLVMVMQNIVLTMDADESDARVHHQHRVNEMLGQVVDALQSDCAHLIKSGGIELFGYETSEYALAKIVITAAIKRNVDIVNPLHRSGQTEVKRLIQM